MDSNAVEEQAADWLCQQMQHSWNPEIQTRFEAWLNQRLAHRFAYLRLQATWRRSAKLKVLGDGVPAGVIPPRHQWADTRFPLGVDLLREKRPVSSSSQVSRWRFALAATVVLAIAAGGYFKSSDFSAKHYVTEVGRYNTVPLSDGSKVILNTDSAIQVKLDHAERRIDLTRGEAYFDVAPDPSRPFIVNAGRHRIVAVGTRFSVLRDGANVRVVVTEGKVRLEDPQHAAGEAVFLTAGGVARTSNAQVLVSKTAPVEAENLLRWRSGYLFFKDTPLSDAVAEFNRYNTRKIVIDDPQLAVLQLGGSFRADNTEVFLWLLRNGFPISIEEHADRVILKAR